MLLNTLQHFLLQYWHCCIISSCIFYSNSMMMWQTSTRFNNYGLDIVCKFTKGLKLIVAFVESIVSVEADTFFIDLGNSVELRVSGLDWKPKKLTNLYKMYPWTPSLFSSSLYPLIIFSIQFSRLLQIIEVSTVSAMVPTLYKRSWPI